MAAQPRPTARRISMGQDLRALRQQAGLTMEEAVEGLEFSDSLLQKVETGLSSLRRAQHLRSLLERYGVTDETYIEGLIATQREASSEEWISDYKDSMTPAQMPKFVGLEEIAVENRVFHPLLPWGPLQSEPYVRALFAMQQPVLENRSESVDKAARLRLRRREFLTRAESPLELKAVIGEPALRHIVGDIEVMRGQCDELVKLSQLDNVTIQILPATGRRYRFAADFSILNMGEDYPPQVQADNAWGGMQISGKPRDVGVFTRRWEKLSASALPPEETPDFIQQLSRELA
ncbi:helix-turn-helix domain-containing protein [Streptomyces cyaneofuscatus]